MQPPKQTVKIMKTSIIISGKGIRENNATQETGRNPKATFEYDKMLTSKILKTFKFYPHNRGMENGVDIKRANQIANEIINKGTEWLLKPIIVNGVTKTILDGHTALTAAKIVLERTGRDIEFLVMIKYNIPQFTKFFENIADFNNKAKPWSTDNYIECYVLEGVEDYVKLKEAAIKLGAPFIKKNGNPNYRYVAALVGSTDNGAGGMLRKGEFKYTDEILERGERVKDVFFALTGNINTSAWFERFIVAYVRQEESGTLTPEQLKSLYIRHKDEFVFNGSTKTDDWAEQFRNICRKYVTIA